MDWVLDCTLYESSLARFAARVLRANHVRTWSRITLHKTLSVTRYHSSRHPERQRQSTLKRVVLTNADMAVTVRATKKAIPIASCTTSLKRLCYGENGARSQTASAGIHSAEPVADMFRNKMSAQRHLRTAWYSCSATRDNHQSPCSNAINICPLRPADAAALPAG